MKTISKSLIAVFIFLLVNSVLLSQSKSLTKYVNPIIGTSAHGHTYPGATLPFGMMQLSPDTGIDGWDWCSGYHYSDNTLMGFSHTHLSGTGGTDYADILLMPTVGKVQIKAGSKENPDEGYRSRFSHSKEIASPAYYSVFLDDYKIKAELTASYRSGIHKYTFPKSEESNIIIDLFHGLDNAKEGYIKFTSNNKIEGYRISNGWAKEHTFYFVAHFSKPAKQFGIFTDDKLKENANEAKGKNVKAYVNFSTLENEAVLVRIGISAVSIEGARKNLEKEIPNFNFDAVKKNGEKIWEKELDKIKIEGATEEQSTIFYTALYHSMITPNIFSDVDGNYFGMDGKIHKAKGFDYYTVFSLWDTFRALHPLFTIIDKKRTNDWVNTLIEKYKESGLLPVWELASNETYTMIGYHSIPVIYDAYVKGIRNFDTNLALEAMKNSATRDHRGLKFYKQRGFIPADQENESVSKTLEYAYNDWCIAQFAKSLGKQEDFNTYNLRSLFYKNLFDKSTGFFRGKLSNGKWIEPFNPLEVSHQYTEATAWQYNFFVPQDIKGLIALHNGKEGFAKKIDEMFTQEAKLEGRLQPDITGLIGQYAHGNEPSHNFAYLYNYAGSPWKTQSKIREILETMYTTKPDGLCGNDDCGQMSAWYVFSAMGFYPVTPGTSNYAIGSPLFKKVTITLENGKKFVINAKNVSKENMYIQRAAINGKQLNDAFITHQQIMNGGNIEFIMDNKPQKDWGTNADIYLTSIPESNGVLMPYSVATGEIFYDSVHVKLNCETKGAAIRFTLDGSEPSQSSLLYKAPIIITSTTTLKAASFLNKDKSFTLSTEFVKAKYPAAVYTYPFNNRYNGGGFMALTDGRYGTTSFQDGAWQGFEGTDVEAVIDLTTKKQINKLTSTFINDPNVWIFLPSKVEYYISDDAKNFTLAGEILNNLPVEETSVIIKAFEQKLENIFARYVKIKAVGVKTCPPWHKGAGYKSWTFIDELNID